MIGKGDQRTLSHAADIAATWKRERPDLDLTGFLLSIYVMRLGRIFDDVYDRMCRKHFGISGADMRVLFALRRAGKPFALRATDLYRALLVTSGAITKQVDRLSKLGFVERIVAGEDSGGNLVSLTSKGLKAANGAFEALTKDSVIAKAIDSISPNQRTAAYAFCERMLLKMESVSNGDHSSSPRDRKSLNSRKQARV